MPATRMTTEIDTRPHKVLLDRAVVEEMIVRFSRHAEEIRDRPNSQVRPFLLDAIGRLDGFLSDKNHGSRVEIIGTRSWLWGVGIHSLPGVAFQMGEGLQGGD